MFSYTFKDETFYTDPVCSAQQSFHLDNKTILRCTEQKPLCCSEVRTIHNIQCEQNVQSLGAFAELRKTTISFVTSARPSVCMELRSRWKEFSWNFILEYFFRHPVDNTEVSLKSDKLTCTLHKHRYTLMITSRSILLRTRNVSNKCRWENQNTHSTPSNFFF